MARSRPVQLSAEQEAQAQELAARLRAMADEELVAMSRLLVGQAEHETFGDSEFEVRDIVLRIGAKAFEAHLASKKTATAAAASIARSARTLPSSRATAPSR